MIYLYKNEKDYLSASIKDKLDDLSLRYQERSTNENHTFIKDNDQVYKGEEDINEFIKELKFELEHERSISGDACYLDQHSGEVC